MTRKRGRGTPRRLTPASWAVARLRRYQPRPGEPVVDVTMLSVDGSWEHGQHQEVRVPFPTEEVRSIAHALLDAVPAESTVVDGGRAPSPAGPATTPSPDAAASSIKVGSTVSEAPGPGREGVGRPPARPGTEDRHAYVLDLLRQRLEEYFHGRRRAGSAFVEQALRRNEVSSIEDLPTEAIAALLNQLQRAPRSRSTPHQGAQP